jgi:hypothetical protein
MNKEDYHQELMNEFYDFWQGSGLERKVALAKFDDLHQAAVMLGNLNYQVTNGGFNQWNFNGYSEDIEELLGICDNGIALELNDFKTLKELLIKFKEAPEPENYYQEYDCPECYGHGTVEEYDENGEEENVTCDECGGSGELEEEMDNEDEIENEIASLNEPYFALDTILDQMNTLLLRWHELKDVKIENYNTYKASALKPTCNLKGVDGNVFSVIGHVSKTLKKAGLKDKAKEFAEIAMKQNSYDSVLSLIPEYTEIEWR